jgi:hypothetical protein
MGDIADYYIDQMSSGRMPSGYNKTNLRRNDIMTTDNTSTKVITGKVRLSYAHIWEPTPDDNGVLWYNTSILIAKDDKETLRKIKAVTDVLKAQATAKNSGKLPPKFKMPLRDGDEERPDDEAYAGHYFFSAKSKGKPGIAKPVGKNADNTTKFQEITDTTEVYSGCYVKVSVNLYLFDTKGNRGIAAGLNNIVKIQDGEAMAGRASVNEDFAGEEFEDIVDISDDEDYLS